MKDSLNDQPPHVKSDETFTSLDVLEPTESAVTTSSHIGAANFSLVPIVPTAPLAPVAFLTSVAPLASVAPLILVPLSATAAQVAPLASPAPVAPQAKTPPLASETLFTPVAPLTTITLLVPGASLLAQVALRDPAALLAPVVPSAPLVVQVPLTPQVPQQTSGQPQQLQPIGQTQHPQVQPNNQYHLEPNENCLISSGVLESTESATIASPLVNDVFLHRIPLRNKTIMSVNPAPCGFTTSTNSRYNESKFKGLPIGSGAVVRSIRGTRQLTALQHINSLVLLNKKSLTILGGLACSFVMNYGAIFAYKFITVAPTSTDYDLWHAFKSGTNDFGIVMYHIDTCVATSSSPESGVTLSFRLLCCLWNICKIRLNGWNEVETRKTEIRAWVEQTPG